jgi:histidinol-phosphate/aromatic aminotransferase/cobyric acid decarboxylase-like protein
MAVRGGDPGVLDQGAGQVEQPARTLEPMSKAAAAAGQKAGGASGNPKVAGAVERFTAAWGGELLSDAVAGTTLAQAAREQARQLRVATGDGS